MPFGAGSVMIKTSNSVAEYIGSYDIHRRRKVAEKVVKNPGFPAKRTSRTWRSFWSSWRTTTTSRTSGTTGNRTKGNKINGILPETPINKGEKFKIART